MSISLIERQAAGEALSVHPLLQVVARKAGRICYGAVREGADAGQGRKGGAV